VPVAENCPVVPRAIVGFVGVTAMETKDGAATLKAVEPLTLPDVAVIVAAPCPTPLASPWLPAELLIVAMATLDELHATEFVRFCVEPPL